MYKILYTNEAKSSISKLPIKKKHQIKEAVERVAENPQIGKHLTHELKGLLSYRSGIYRIIYRVYHKEVLVLILTIGHRKNVYEEIGRKLK
ncbi:MAG: type II toxin-antitoxin system RelE/ParE family toxin [Candidatus Omnitrophota bacterium]